MGDMGNWNLVNGRIQQTKVLDLITLTGDGSIIGRGVVLHGETDSCANGQTTTRHAYGVIGIANPGTGNTNEALAPQGAAVTSAICRLLPTTAVASNTVTGTVVLTQDSPTGPTNIIAYVSGLDGAPHGFHIHEWGDVSNANGNAAGNHYNPLGVEHGIPPFDVRHVGDMGNIYHYEAGIGYYNYTNDRISLTGPNSVIGHTIIVHNATDNCGQPTGNAGVRLAQCVIGVKNPATVDPTLDDNTPDTQDSTPCDPVDTNTSTEDGNFAATQTVSLVLVALALAALGACSVKEEKTVQQPSASAPASTAPAGTTTSKTYSLF